MATVSVRTMTRQEFDEWQDELAAEYAAEQIASGRWPAEGAVERARAENMALLPDGPATARMLTLRGVDADGEPVGRAWVGLDHPRGAPGIAFLYDIEVLEPKRRLGYGRALLDAVEDAAGRAGAAALELNVFGSNSGAIGLYSGAGYEVVTQQMRKSLHGR
ncbi:GNAT family N-acetyltransferase [Agromyces soli]